MRTYKFTLTLSVCQSVCLFLSHSVHTISLSFHTHKNIHTHIYMSIYIYIYIYEYQLFINCIYITSNIHAQTLRETPVQSSKIVEYADYLCKWGRRLNPISVMDMKLNCLMVRIQSWSFCNLECTSIAINSRSNLIRRGRTWLPYESNSVVFWPSTRPDMPFQRRGSCIFHWRRRALLTIWDRVKIPRYSQKLKHRNRVTSEMHDSYFHLMTIKNAIPKIEWAIELLYNSVETGSQWVGDQMS